MVYPLLPAFVTRTLGGGALALGALDGVADLTASLLRVLSGRWADRPGWQRPLIRSGYAIATVVRPLITLAGAAWQVIVARAVDRMGKGLRSPARDALIAQVTPAPARGRAYGFQRAADHLGAVAGSLTAWFLLTQGVEVRHVILWSALPGFFALVVLSRVLDGRTEQRKDGQDRAGKADGSSFRPSVVPSFRQFWPPVMALTLLTVARLPETLLLLRLQDLGVAVAVVPLAWAGLHIVRSAAAYPGGWLSDRIGPRAMIGAGGLLFAGALTFLARELSAFVAIAGFLVLGWVSALSEASDRQVVAALGQGGAGRAFGNAQALSGLAALPAGLAFGALFQNAGGPMALRASAVATMIAVVIWLGLTRQGLKARRP